MGDVSDSTFEIGMVLNDKWVVLEAIGKGGTGEVYRAHQLNLKRDIALKVISQKVIRELADNPYEAETCLERFRREVQVMAQIRHPNVLQIFDYGSTSLKKQAENITVEYIAMEYIPGATLRSTMSAEGFYPDEGLTKEWLSTFFLPLLSGVRAFHDLGIVHRDLKPENVLLDGKIPKIADFGLARSSRVKPVTQSIDITGTPPYMAPEHFLDLKRTDQRTDIYALGKILYEAVSGKIKPDEIPFRQAKLKSPEPPFFQALDRIVQEATAEERDERLPSVEALKEALEIATQATGEGPPTIPEAVAGEARTWRKPVIFLVMVVLFGALISFGTMLVHKRDFVPPSSEPGPLADSTQGKVLKEEAGSPAVKPQGSALAPTLQSGDHAILRLVPGGKFTLPKEEGMDGGKSIEVIPFYMDETQVTNHQYAEFLNEVLSRLKVEKGLVYGDGQLWAILGEVMKGYEPIIFDRGKFYVNSAQHAACPVLRVTAYGATAYTKFYGKRLPNEEEWLYVAMAGGKTRVEPTENAGKATGVKKGEDADEAPASQQMPPSSSNHHMTMSYSMSPSSSPSRMTVPPPSPVMLADPDDFGIKGLNGDFREWAVRKTDYVVLGRYWTESGKASDLPSSVRRYPWEAFEEVGFRCAMSVQDQVR